MCFALALALSTAAIITTQSPGPDEIVHTYTLGGDGRWDYITPDAPNHRVFIARQNRVMVVDTNDGHIVGEISDIHGAHGVALVERSGRGFATSGGDGSVVMLDAKSLKVLRRIPAAEDADAILYDRASSSQ